MADYPPITLAGGLKAARPAAAASCPVAPPMTPVETAFAAVNEWLADAVDALARCDDPASADPAHAAIAAADLRVGGALHRALRRIDRTRPIVTSDQALISAARIIALGLRGESEADLDRLIGTLGRTYPVFLLPARGDARGLRAMVESAIARLRLIRATPDLAARLAITARDGSAPSRRVIAPAH